MIRLWWPQETWTSIKVNEEEILQFLLTRGLVDDGKDTFYITPESGGEVSLIIEIRVWFNNTQNFAVDSSSWFQITSYNPA